MRVRLVAGPVRLHARDRRRRQDAHAVELAAPAQHLGEAVEVGRGRDVAAGGDLGVLAEDAAHGFQEDRIEEAGAPIARDDRRHACRHGRGTAERRVAHPERLRRGPRPGSCGYGRLPAVGAPHAFGQHRVRHEHAVRHARPGPELRQRRARRLHHGLQVAGQLERHRAAASSAARRCA